ncbi:MAG: ABC transporter ATP-binding protein [Promethearchaeota archaeon]
MINTISKDMDTLITIRDLSTYFYTYAGVVKALDGVNLEILKGETLGLVGETGCGKSVTARCIIRLILHPGKIMSGNVMYQDRDLLQISDEEIRKIRGRKISIVFQDPATYLNPVMTVGRQLIETIELHQDLTQDAIKLQLADRQKAIKAEIAKLREKSLTDENAKIKLEQFENELKLIVEGTYDQNITPKRKYTHQAYREKAIEVLKTVRLPDAEEILSRYPHELSGGMRQRCMIAISLVCRPDLLIADEATTALDVTIQAQILHLLNELKEELNTSVLIITHDLGIVAETCQRVAVMYAGTVVEVAETLELFANTTHPYTKGLLKAIPKLSVEVDELEIIPGIVPNLIDPPGGCRFHPRCPDCQEVCKNVKPRLSRLPGDKIHLIACHVHGTEDYVYDDAREMLEQKIEQNNNK